MTTLFALLCNRCGLSQREAAQFLGVSPSSVDKMARGIRSAPAGVIMELRRLHAQIEHAASEAVGQIAAIMPRPDEIEIGLASDDHEAQSLGWPCVGAHAAMIGIVAARVDIPVIIVPRGSTPATAAAADAHSR